MLSQIAYVRQQITAAQRASTPSARADHLQRALDGLDRVECQAREFLHGIAGLAPAMDELAGEPVDPFLPAVCRPGKGNQHPNLLQVDHHQHDDSMSSMHVSVFIRPNDKISSSALALDENESFVVTVRMINPQGEAGEVALFADDANQLLEFGRAIVRECETFPASAPSNKPGDPVAFSVVQDPTSFEPPRDGLEPYPGERHRDEPF